MKKKINEKNLVGTIANEKINSTVKLMADCFAETTIEPGVHLKKVILSEHAFGHRAGKPFYAFAKRAGELTFLVDLISGHLTLVNDAVITSMTKVTGRFTIDGIIYDRRDTVNGLPRYQAVGTTGKKTTKSQRKRDALDELIAAAQDALDAYWLDDEPGNTADAVLLEDKDGYGLVLIF